MKVLMIDNYDSEDVNEVKYNGVSELDILKLLGLRMGERKGVLRDHELEWSNYKKILEYFRDAGYTHILTDDGLVEGEESIEEEIEFAEKSLESILESRDSYIGSGVVIEVESEEI